MFKIALCDDNEQFIKIENEILQDYFDSCGEEYYVDSFCSGAELLRNSEKLANYNLILLDCEMPDMNGLEVAKRICEMNIKTPVAFSTNYYDFTIMGYHYGIVRYLVKSEDSFKDNIIECIEHVKTIKKENDHLSLKVDGIMHTYNQKDIVLIASEKHYLTIYIRFRDGEKWNCSEIRVRMKIEDLVPEMCSSFLRVHQRNMINMDYIVEFTPYHVVINTGSQSRMNVSMTVRNKRELQKKYYAYKGSLQ